MEATPAPRLFNSGEMSWKLVRATVVEYISRDIFYGHHFGIQVHYDNSSHAFKFPLHSVVVVP